VRVRSVHAVSCCGRLIGTATVFDLLLASYGVPRDAMPGHWPSGYDDEGELARHPRAQAPVDTGDALLPGGCARTGADRSRRGGRTACTFSPDSRKHFPVEPYEVPAERISSGIPAIDQMLADGYWSGASTLVAGPSGSGKTLMGLHFIFNGAAAGEPGILATLQENAIQLERISKGFGWSLTSESVELMHRSPVDLYLDEWFYELLEVIDRTQARRVFIDSLGDPRRASVDELRFREYLYSLLQRCAQQQISVMMSQETPGPFGVPHLSEEGASHLSDNVILLQLVSRDAQLRRAVTVLKTRATRHEPDVREFKITPKGIVLGEPLNDPTR
jgi:KaiC/GvpD/RAD55 family RecA-like ATPase